MKPANRALGWRNKQAEGEGSWSSKAKSTVEAVESPLETRETNPGQIKVCNTNTYVPKEKSRIKKVEKNGIIAN